MGTYRSHKLLQARELTSGAEKLGEFKDKQMDGIFVKTCAVKKKGAAVCAKSMLYLQRVKKHLDVVFAHVGVLFSYTRNSND